MSAVVAVTGATGFIGTWIVRRLLEADVRVKAFVRPCSEAKCLQHPGLEWIVGDLEDTACLERLVGASDAVVHCAGIVRGICPEDFEGVNTRIVYSLVEFCCRRLQPPRLLMISSLAAREPELSYYARSKKLGENALKQAGTGIPWTIFRPPAVYGPGDREMRPLFRCIARGIVPCLAAGGNRFSLLHVHDLAEAVLYGLNSPAVSKKVYELHDGFPGGYTWEDIACAAERVYRRRMLKLRMPAVLLKTAGFLNAAAARIHGRPPMLTLGKARELAHHDWVCDNTEICRDTGWTPRILLEDALKSGLV